MYDYKEKFEKLDNWVFQRMNDKKINKVVRNVYQEVYNKIKSMEVKHDNGTMGSFGKNRA